MPILETPFSQTVSDLHCDLAIVGTGLAGSAAALFAAARGVDTIRIGVASQLLYASGLLDLMGVHPVGDGTVRTDPWAAIREVARDLPDHPYARIPAAQIRAALLEFLAAVAAEGLAYRWENERNVAMLLPTGGARPTWAVPASMWQGVTALRQKTPCLIVGIRNLRGFSARQIVETRRHDWPGLCHATISVAGNEAAGEVYAEPLARSLALAPNREALAAAVRPHLGSAEAVGFPALLGLGPGADVVADMAARLGRPVFEIPTMPPAVPGLRLQEAMNARLREQGVRSLFPQRVRRVEHHAHGFVLGVGEEGNRCRVHARGVILATGRFVGGGLRADRTRIRETVLDLPVYQPPARADWHRRAFFDPRGHRINRSGIEVDDRLRPLDRRGRPAFARLFAAGSILAHQDWMRAKCGTGLSVATAWRAVQSFLETQAPAGGSARSLES